MHIENNLSKKINLNRLKTNQKIQFTVDQSNNHLKEFIFQISNAEKLYLTKNVDKSDFNQEIILTKLKMKTRPIMFIF